MADKEMPAASTSEMTEEEAKEGAQYTLYEEEVEDSDPLGRLSNQEITEIYIRLPSEERKLYKELLQNYRVQDKLFGTIVPTYQQVRSIIREAFPKIPMENADKLMAAQHQLLKEERLREMCQSMGFAMFQCLEGEAEPKVLREEECPHLRFKPLPTREDGDNEDSEDEEAKTTSMEAPLLGILTASVKGEPDVKPRLATQVKSEKQLCKLLGGHEDCFITRIRTGRDPMSHYIEDNPVSQQVVELSFDEDANLIEDLSDASEDVPFLRKGLTEALKNLANSYRTTGEWLDVLVRLTGDMTLDQVEDTAVEVADQLQGCQGWQVVLSNYEKKDIPLILAIGCRKYEEVEVLRKRWLKPISYDTLAAVFGITKRQIQDGCRTASY